MIEAAQHLEQAEKALRVIVCDLAAAAPASPAVYETLLELAAVGRAMQERIRAELQEAEGEAALFIGVEI